MKRIFLIVCSIFIILESFGQNVKHQTLDKVVNNAILYQALNNFNENIPLFLYYPGFVFVGNVSYQANPLFFDTDYYDRKPNRSAIDHFHKDIIEALNAPFIPYIPKDSAMTVRFIHDRQLLFEMSFVFKGDTLVFTQSNPGRSKVKTVMFDNGKHVATSFGDVNNRKYYKDVLQGDTLRLMTWTKIVNGQLSTKQTRVKYSNGLPVMTERSKSNVKSEKKLDYTMFKYDGQNRLVAEETYKPNEKLKKSINYLYNESQLIRYEKKGGETYTVDLTYNDGGMLYSKNYQAAVKAFLTSYYYSGNNYREMVFKSTKGAHVNYSFSINSDIRQKIVELIFDEHKEGATKGIYQKRWLLDYDESGNLIKVKLLNSRGTILKEITAEYTWYKP